MSIQPQQILNQAGNAPYRGEEIGICRAELMPGVDWTDVRKGEHLVQFYESDSFLVRSISAYIGTGLKAGDAGVVIATREHLDAVEECMRADSVMVSEAQAQGRYFRVDATQTLAEIMDNGRLDEARLDSMAAKTVDLAGRGRRPIRVFGEMVMLLWAEGNAMAAVQLEELWDKLAKSHPFSLLCAYPMQGFQGAKHGEPFAEICRAHSRVIPTESYLAQADREAQLRAVGLLQQQAGSLQGEIAQRRHAESAVRVEQTKLDMAVAIAGLGIWELDLATSALTCSEECKAKLGLGPNESLTYERLWALMHPEDRSAAESALRRAVADNTDYQAEFRIISNGGQVRWIACLGHCLHNDKHHLLGVMQDVTERKRALEMLEQRVAERTTQLREAVGELEAFSYSITHDMRAPLRAMEGFAKAVLEDSSPQLSPEGITHLELIKRAAQRLDMLIQDVLCYSKIAKTQIELKPIALGPFLEDLLRQWPEFVSARNSILIEAPLHTVLAHEASLTQCLVNLIGNALKFVAPGTVPEVRIRTQAAGDKVRVLVIDNGIGIHPKHRGKIFNIFSRVYSEELYEGTGIGLAIVKKAVTRMGGEVGFDSTPGMGSTFWFVLPMGAEERRG